MTGDRDEVIGRLAEELDAALAGGETVVVAQWAARFDVEEAAVRACLRGLSALATSLGEELQQGAPELPAVHLPEDFEVVGELGRGGMGVVYRARQRSLDREVAIKVLRPADLVFGDALRRFRSEARSLARLRHRHIVSVHDCGETLEGLLWFAMDLVDGRTLADELRSSRRFLPARAVKVIRQVASAVAHAHAQGIVHRDLKPQNVLIDAHGDAFVVDFGLARDAAAAGTRTMTGELLGTPAYMSPEQASGDGARIGEACDVWALGALLYEMLAGHGPFSGKPLHETIRAILHDDPPPLRKIDKRVPLELEVVCQQALQKRPEDRYPTALAFGEDVERFADGRGVLARQPSAWRRFARLARRRGRLVAATTAAVVVTLLFVLAWLPTIRRDAVIAEARRLLATGHPAAAVESLRTALAERPGNAAAFEQLEYDYVRALGDRIGELLLAHDEAGAEQLAAQALKITGRRHTYQGVVRSEDWDRQLSWRWEHARAAAASAAQERPGRVPVAALQTDLQSGLAGRVALARRVAALGWVDVSGLPEALRLPILADGVRMAGQRTTGATGFPFTWSGVDLDSWWSPGAEDLLAELATSADEAASTRAVAFRSWAQVVGLPTRDELQAGEALDAAAAEAIAPWRSWRSLSREGMCRARIDQLVAGRAIAAARRWTGHEAPPGTADDAAEFEAWWQKARQEPFAPLLRRALGLEDGADVPLVEALDRSATADPRSAPLWRQLAWLQVPDAARVPLCAPPTGDGGLVWRTVCLRAAGVDIPRSLAVRAVLLRFDDGGCEPELVAQGCEVVRLGDEVRLELRAQVVDMDGISLRPAWLDEELRTLRYYAANDATRMPTFPPLGQITAAFEGRVSLDRDGPRLDCTPGALSRMLPWIGASDGHLAPGRVRVGGATTLAESTVFWDMHGRLTEFVLLVGMESSDVAEPAGLEWWRGAIARSFETASPDTIDWATAALWPMPEALPAMQARVADGKRAAETMVRAAMLLAGGGEHLLDVWPYEDRMPIAAVGVRLAVGSASPEVRRRAIDTLAELPAAAWTPRIGRTLQQVAAAAAVEFPEPLAQRLAALPAPDSVVDRLSRLSVPRIAILLTLLAYGLFDLLRGAPARRRVAAWVAFGSFWLLWVRVQVGGVILTPSALLILFVTVSVWLAGTGRRRSRLVGLAVLGLFTLWALVSWAGFGGPPAGGEIIVFLAATMAIWPESRPALRATRPARSRRAQK